jgi:hypothetical protein
MVEDVTIFELRGFLASSNACIFFGFIGHLPPDLMQYPHCPYDDQLAFMPACYFK